MIRAASVDDVDAIALLEADNLGADAWSWGLVAAGVGGEVPSVAYLVADLGGVVVGYAAVSVVADIAELQRIAVTPERRRTGLATELLDAVSAGARAGGADRLLLEVREDNSSALGFYAVRGFLEIDRRRRYYSDGTTAVVMRRGLVKGCG